MVVPGVLETEYNWNQYYWYQELGTDIEAIRAQHKAMNQTRFGCAGKGKVSSLRWVYLAKTKLKTKKHCCR